MKAYTARMQTEFISGKLMPIMFAQLVFDGATDRYCTAGADVDWNGQTWTGIGGVVTIGPIKESDSLEAHGLTFTIGGVNPADTSGFFTEKFQGREITVWYGLIGDESGETVVLADPEVEFVGRLDAPRREIDGERNATITIPAESRMLRWGIPSGSRYTHEEQQRLYPGDDLFIDVAAIAESIEIKWPAKEFFG